jgi:hypothetical protein
VTKYFVIVFLCMAIYGFAIHRAGAACLSLFMAGFTMYGHVQLRKRDIEFYMDPRNAKHPPNTQDLLNKYNCEAG